MNIDGLKKLLEHWSKKGMYLPAAWDQDKKGPSATLLSFYIGLTIASASLIALHFKASLIAATSMALLFLGMTFIFYKLRKIDSVKVDLDDKQIDLSSHRETTDDKDKK